MADKKRLMVPLVHEYLEEKKATGKRPAQPDWTTLLAFAEEWDATGRFRSSVDAQFARRWFVKRPNITPSTRRTYASKIKTFLKWGVLAGYFDDRSCYMFDPGKTSSKRSTETVWLNQDQLWELWESQNWYWRGIIAFTALTMLRQSEVYTLKVGDITGDWVNVNRWKTDDLGDAMPLPADLRPEIKRYLAAYAADIGRPLEPDMYLFPPVRRRQDPRQVKIADPYQERGIYLAKKVKLLILDLLPESQANNTELCRGLGAHTLRRSMARVMYEFLVEQGEHDAMRVIQGMLGHEDVQQTQRYIGLGSVKTVRNRVVQGMGSMRREAKVLPFPGQKSAAG